MSILVPKNPLRWNFRLECGSGWKALFFAILFLGFCFPERNEAQTISHEYPLKAVFLLNFARFTTWPENAFENPDSPFIIGILGENPFGSLVDDTVQDEQLNHHKFIVEYYHQISDIKTCNMLFISQSEANHLDKILAKLQGRPILTIADSPEAADKGVCVQFVNEENKIRLRINIDSLKGANLTMSSELLRLAEVVSTSPK